MQLTRKQLLSVSAAILSLICIAYISRTDKRRHFTVSFQRQGDSKEVVDFGLCEMAPSHGGWQNEPPSRCSRAAVDDATCGHKEHKVWRWHQEALACNVRRATSADVKGLLQDQWFAVVGDSVGRNLFAAFVRLLANEGRYPVVKGHQDFEYKMPGGIKASFVWAPYTSNATARLNGWMSSKISPDVILFSMGLWHMLHVTSAESFSRDMAALRQAADAFVAFKQAAVTDKVAKYQAYRLDLCSISALHNGKMKTSEKQEKMTPGNVKAYNEVIYNSGTFLPKGPMHLQDVHNITQGCGADCTEDGIHYIDAAYDAAMQIYINSIHLSPFG